MTAILFGSIGTIVDTSEMQRASFNQAFGEHGLDWNWDRETYVEMLSTSGGENRIAEYASSRDEDVDAAAVHQTKSTIFQTAMDAASLEARPGVVDTVKRGREDGSKVALVTTTSDDNVSTMIGAVDGLSLDDFDLTLTRADIDAGKPDPEAYALAVERLGVSADECVAIEDNVDGVASAVAAGIACVAFPNENTASHDFSSAMETVDSIDIDHLGEIAGS